MTNSEYQDLIAFLGRKFEEIDRRFEEVATKEMELVSGPLSCGP